MPKYTDVRFLKAAKKQLKHHKNLCAFLDEQIKRTQTDPRGMRWGPLMHRLALAVFVRSPSAYEALRNENIIAMPERKTVKGWLHRERRKVTTKGDLMFLRVFVVAWNLSRPVPRIERTNDIG